MKFSRAVAVAAMGMGPAFAPKVAEALTAKKRPSVVYLHNAECTGCSESVLRTVDPYVDELILDVISMDYHETLMAGAGHAVEEALHEAIKGDFVCVIEGGIPMGDGGYWGKVGGRNMYDICAEVAPKAKGGVAIGTAPPTVAKGLGPKAKPNHGHRGCERSPGQTGREGYQHRRLPAEPHELCGHRGASAHQGHARAGQARPPGDVLRRNRARQLPPSEALRSGRVCHLFGSPEAKKGYCLYELGCKGPDTYNNCPKQLFNQVNWPVQAGHPCIACSEPNFWDLYSPFYSA
nr:periplasmic [NiFe]hydrogenase protein small subunit precursor [Megalodesulfovibrio gigas]